MKISEFKTSKWLKQEDIEAPTRVTIAQVTRENVAQEGQPEEWKAALHFVEDLKPMICNSTNLDNLAAYLGDETDNWSGKQCVVWVDPSVSYAGKRVGGLRVRQPKAAKVVQNPDADDV